MSLEPELPEVLDDHRQAILGELHISMPGRVKSYDAAKQTAEIIPCVRGTIPDGDGNTLHEDLPVIPNVPIAWPRGGGFYMHFPLAVGDHVWLVFNTTSFAQWRATGEVSDPGDLRRGTLSYPWAYPGAAPDAQALSDAPAGQAVLGGGVFRVGGPSAVFVSQATKVDQALAQLKAAISSAASTEAGASGLGGMTALLGALSSWPGPSVAATKLKAE